MKKFKQFLEMHNQAEPLMIGNVWNVQSARMFEKNGYQALATSSAAIAETYGHQDGEEMPFSDYLFMIRKIAQSTDLPFSVDLEAGYGDSVQQIVSNIKTLADLGIVGINIEDSNVSNGVRTLTEAKMFTEKIMAICNQLDSERIEMFINVRTDVFLLGIEHPLSEALTRIEWYKTTGAHGLFLPCITDLTQIARIVQATSLPVNVMCMPGLPDFSALKQAGVKRISSGNFVNNQAYSELDKSLGIIHEEQSFKSLFKPIARV